MPYKPPKIKFKVPFEWTAGTGTSATAFASYYIDAACTHPSKVVEVEGEEQVLRCRDCHAEIKRAI